MPDAAAARACIACSVRADHGLMPEGRAHQVAKPASCGLMVLRLHVMSACPVQSGSVQLERHLPPCHC